MYCKKCGLKNNENSKFCQACGSPLESPVQPAHTPQQQTYPQQQNYSQPPVYNNNHYVAVNGFSKTPTDKKLIATLFSSFALCILGIIMPFLTWIDIPSLKSSFIQGAFELFGGQGNLSSFSIFSYSSFVSKYGRNEDIRRYRQYS